MPKFIKFKCDILSDFQTMWVCKLIQRVLLLGIASKLERWIISPCHHNWRPYRSGNNLQWSSPHCHQHSHSSNWTSHVHNGSKTVQGSVWSWETQKRKWKSSESKRCSLMSIGWSGSCCCRYTKKIGVWFQSLSWVIHGLEKKRWSISFLKKYYLKYSLDTSMKINIFFAKSRKKKFAIKKKNSFLRKLNFRRLNSRFLIFCQLNFWTTDLLDNWT